MKINIEEERLINLLDIPPPFLHVIFLTGPVVAGVVLGALSVTVQHVGGNVDRGHTAIQLQQSYIVLDL